MLRFSIVITTYNRLPLLRRAVESALAQTWPCEVVVADDGSCDGTEEYIRGLGDRVIYHRNPINLGHCVTMNAGVKLAKGNWIKPLDDDDYLAPNCIEEMLRAIAQYPQAVLCSCQAIQVNPNRLEVYCTKPVGFGDAFYILQEDIHYGMLLEQLPFGTPVQVAFSKDAFFKSGGWDSDFEVNYDDIDSWVKIAQYGNAVFLNKCLAYRTLWPGNISGKLSLQQRVDKNIAIKNKIYALVHEKHQKSLPNLRDIHTFLKLHWSLVGFKQKKFLAALRLAYPAIFSLKAWKIFTTVIYLRRISQNAQHSLVANESIPQISSESSAITSNFSSEVV